mgnify:CR=1 FL=1
MRIGLTPAEAKYVGLLAGGISIDEICERNNVKRPSLNAIFYRVRKKCGVKTNTQLVSAFLTKQTTQRM